LIVVLRILKRLWVRLGSVVSETYLLTKYRMKKSLRSWTKLSNTYHGSKVVLFETDKSLGLNPWVFHNENWVRVIHRREHRRIVAAGKPLEVVDNLQKPTKEVTFLEDGTIQFNGKAETKDEWFYLYLDSEKHRWYNYSWQVRIRRDSYFREFQLGFRYQDFYNRYRYRIENDYIYFDKVVRGKFLNHFGSSPFHMVLGVWYDVRIDIYENNFKCYVNGILMLDDIDFDNSFPFGSIALILWENDGVTDIKASVGPMSICELELDGKV
jgi:hypothetical protein